MLIRGVASDTLRPPSHLFRAQLQLLLLSTLTLVLSASPMPPSTPPNVVAFRFLKGFAVIVPVYLNGSGPFDLMLDTGSSCTTVDRELADSLQLPAHGTGTVSTLVRNLVTSHTEARTIRIGPITESSVKIFVRDLDGLHHLDPRIRGVLGQDVLKHADYLLDYQHHQIVFDDDGRLLSSLSGERTPVVKVPALVNADYSMYVIRSVIVDRNVQPRNFLLDSGSASLVLFTERATLNPADPLGVVQDDGGQQLPVSLIPVQLRLGRRSWEVPAHTVTFPGQASGFDGLLPTSLFTQLYICDSGGFVLFNPKRMRSVDSFPAPVVAQANALERCEAPSTACRSIFAEDVASRSTSSGMLH